MTMDINKMLLDHVDERNYLMKTGETYTFEWLLDESMLAATTELERMHLERMLNRLIAFGEVEVDVDGLDEEGKTLYRRVD